jgi:hypothetical protein
VDASRAAQPDRLGKIAGARAGGPGHSPGSRQQAGDGGLADEQQAADEHQGGQDLGAQAMEERGRRPVEPFAQDSAVDRVEALLEVPVPLGMSGTEADGLRGEREEQGGQQQDRPRVHRPRRLDERSHDERHAPARDGERHQVRDATGCVGERGLQGVAHRAAVPTDVENESQVDRDRDQAQADQVEMALLEPAQELPGARPLGPRPRARSRTRTSPRARPRAPAPLGASLARQQHVPLQVRRLKLDPSVLTARDGIKRP